MATIQEQLEAKIRKGPRPTTLRRDPSLGQMVDPEKRHEDEEARKLQQKVERMRAAGERVTYVAELD